MIFCPCTYFTSWSLKCKQCYGRVRGLTIPLMYVPNGYGIIEVQEQPFFAYILKCYLELTIPEQTQLCEDKKQAFLHYANFHTSQCHFTSRAKQGCIFELHRVQLSFLSFFSFSLLILNCGIVTPKMHVVSKSMHNYIYSFIFFGLFFFFLFLPLMSRLWHLIVLMCGVQLNHF